jgi:hypothetical protein
MRMAALSTFELALLKRVKNSSAAGSVGPREIPWADGTSVRDAPPLRKGTCPSAGGQGKEEDALPAILSVWRTGRLRQDPGRAAEFPAETRTYGNGGGVWPNMRWW